MQSTDESRYLQFMPALYQGSADEPAPFLGRFLLAFEKILSGIDDTVMVNDKPIEGIQTILAQFHQKFDPARTPSQFLPWLAGWVALELEEEGWNEARQRQLLARIVPLYQKRGTKEGIKEYIKLYVGEDQKVDIEVEELTGVFQIGVTSTIGEGTIIGESHLYYFQVKLTLTTWDQMLLENKKKALIAIINREKPAHTYYKLIISIPAMKIGETTTVGQGTVLGGIVEEEVQDL